MLSCSAAENTTKAPPWYREITQNTIGPSKLTMARPISAPYSSWSVRIDSGEPSKPDRLASTTTGRLPLAVLIARAVFFDDRGHHRTDVERLLAIGVGERGEDVADGRETRARRVVREGGDVAIVR